MKWQNAQESSEFIRGECQIPTRYPNAHPEGSPFEYYDEDTAKEAIHSAEVILNFVLEVSRRWLK